VLDWALQEGLCDDGTHRIAILKKGHEQMLQE
jgi:hypothetical protein